jgi:hypothetical protein
MVIFPPAKNFCACGKPLHYSNEQLRQTVEHLIEDMGENVTVTIGTRHWLVQRHYIALHGLKAVELPSLGFPEIGPEEMVLRCDS